MDTNNNHKYGETLATTSSLEYAGGKSTGFCTNSSRFICEPMTKKQRILGEEIFDSEFSEYVERDDSSDNLRRKRIVKTLETARKNCIIGVSELCERLMLDTNMWLVEVIDIRQRAFEREYKLDECERLLGSGQIILVKLNVSIANGIANEVKDTFLELAADVELALNDLQLAKNELELNGAATTWNNPMEEGV